MFGLNEFYSHHPGHGSFAQGPFSPDARPVFGGSEAGKKGEVKNLGDEVGDLSYRFFRAATESGISFLSFGLHQLLN